MEVSMISDFNDSELSNVSLSKQGLAEVEDGELVEDTNINITTEEEKKILRAKRFGPVENDSKSKFQDPKLQRLHKRMKVDKDTRLEALLLHGTDNMKTEDVFAFFSGYSPASIEWLSDKTCNAVWLDEESCGKALKNCSVRIKGQNIEDSEDSEDEYINREDIRCALPPGGIWRRGNATQLAPNLFLRFATYSDRREYKPYLSDGDPLRRNLVFLDEGDEVSKKSRVDSGNPWVDIARDWSYYEKRSAAKKHEDRLPFRDARELISNVGRKAETAAVSGKRSIFYDAIFDSEPRSVSSDRTGTGRKMRADIEEKRILSKKLKSRNNHALSNIDLRQRLSRKRPVADCYRKSSSDDETEEVEELKDVEENHKLFRKRKYTEDSWIRAVTDESEDDDQNFQSAEDLRSKLKKNTDADNGKLKQKIGTVLTKSTKKFIPDCPLQIEIDNDIYFERVGSK